MWQFLISQIPGFIVGLIVGVVFVAFVVIWFLDPIVTYLRTREEKKQKVQVNKT